MLQTSEGKTRHDCPLQVVEGFSLHTTQQRSAVHSLGMLHLTSVMALHAAWSVVCCEGVDKRSDASRAHCDVVRLLVP